MNQSNNSIALEVTNLSKQFGAVQAVKDLSFKVQKGEVFGFLGPNGAGKTTTMRMVTCYIPATSGSIRVAGLDITQNDLAVRRKIGYLPETTPLYPDMLVDEYLKFVGEIRQLSGTHLKSRIDEMLQVCGLTTMSHRPIGQLSKGYRQRVGLAQAMIHDPDLLILDEPTSGLDPNQIIDIRQLIKRVGSEKTVIYCSHILSEVSATCDRILIINNGQLVALGTPKEITGKSTHSSHYHLRIKGNQTAVEGALQKVDGVSAVSVQSQSGDWNNFNIASTESEDIGEGLFRCVTQNGWSLSELKRETVSLEEVFTQLTRG